MAKRVSYWKLLSEFMQKLDAEGIAYTLDSWEDNSSGGIVFSHTEWAVRNGKLILVEATDGTSEE